MLGFIPTQTCKQLFYLRRITFTLLTFSGLLPFNLSLAVTDDNTVTEGTRSFTPDYFIQFDPVTALDLVDKIPGFNPQEQSGGRGLDGVRSNMLINGKRPPPKGQSAWQQLSNKPHTHVSHIVLVNTGASSEFDMQGYNQIVNVILKEGGSNYYEFSPQFEETGDGDIRQRNESTTNLEATSTIASGDHEFSLRAGSFDRTTRNPPEFVDIDPANPTQRVSSQNQSDREEQYAEFSSIFNLTNDSTLSLNAEVFTEDRGSAPVSIIAGSVNQSSQNTGDWQEFSGEYRRPIGDSTELMFALLNSQNINSSESSFVVNGTLRSSIRDQDSGESAARFRLEHKLTDNITLRSTLSSAFNYFEGDYQLFEDGIAQSLTGNTSRVEEYRHSLTLGADWNWNNDWTLNSRISAGSYALTANDGIEDISDNKQTEIKGKASILYQMAERTTVKLESEYDIGQLSLNQFLASSSLSSDILTEGAVSLNSEQQWEHKISYDQRFGDRGVLQFTLGHFNLKNPIRSVALSNSLIVSQNSFSEERNWFNASVEYPFTRFNMENLMLNTGFTVSDSKTIDPITLESREVTWVNPLEWSLGLRKNPGDGKWTWGFNLWKNINNKNYSPRSIRDQQRSHEWRAFAVWEIISGFKVRVRLESPRNNKNVSSLFSSVRQPGLNPAFIATSTSRRDSSSSLSIEWRLKKYMEFTLEFRPRPRFQSAEVLTNFGETTGTIQTREIAEGPRTFFKFRVYNR